MGKIADNRKFYPNDFLFYVSEFIRMSEEQNYVIPYDKLREQPYNLPDARWYVKYCPDKSVKRWADFVDWCGFVAKSKKPTKEKTIKLIYKMQSELNRPLMYDDFRGNGCYHIGISLVNEYWGSLNNMKNELGLEVIQESMIDKQLNKGEFDCKIKEICEYVKSMGRDFITTSEINKNDTWINSNTLRKYAKMYYNSSLSDLFVSHGVRIGKQGQGINYTFSDGEKVHSQFEYFLSNYLRNNGINYNIDYFRDVKYSTFIPDYNGNMNCDYVIKINNKIIYIEIAGILAEYKEWYYNNKEISTRKSREKYRLKLLKKENMLKVNGLNYYILFPCDLTNDNFYKILNDSSENIKEEIENFSQHNIDWVKIREYGELDYSKPYLRYFCKETA